MPASRPVKASGEAKGRYSVVIGDPREGMLVEVDEVSIQGVEVNTNSDIVVVDAKVVEVTANRMVVKV
ncbi:MAG: hypothetical protein QXT86_09990 [Archaeoglobaceae archaeon]